jgi:Tfp pilus assembly protein PilN
MKAVNLIPSDERRGGGAVVAGRSQGAAYGVLGLIAGIAVLALMWGIAHHQVTKRHAEVASLTAQTARAQESATKLTPYTSFMALREQRTQAVTQLVDSRFDWAHAVHELGRVLPGDASIASLEGTIGGASSAASTAAATPSATSSATGATTSPAAASSVASATPPGSVPAFTLKGCATSQSAVALTLQRLRLIDGVSSVNLQSSAKATSGGKNTSESSCGVGKPTFSVQIAFDPLPAAPASTGSGTKVTTSTGAGQ